MLMCLDLNVTGTWNPFVMLTTLAMKIFGEASAIPPPRAGTTWSVKVWTITELVMGPGWSD